MRGRRTTSPDALDNATAVSARSNYVQELDNLRDQVVEMAGVVDKAIQNANVVLCYGDLELADEVVAGDDDIDKMFVDLTERCYDLLARQAPVASDMRLVVSVLRILSDLERIGDLCLRIVKLAPFQTLLASNEMTFGILHSMTDKAHELFLGAMRAWASQDLRLAHSLEKRDDVMDAHYSKLMAEVLELDGPDAVPLAVQTLSAGRALERIADRSVMIAERLRYMLTGNLESLSKEIGP